MKTNFILISVPLILLMLISSCNMNNVEPEKKAGYFILTRLSEQSLNNPVTEATLKAGETDFFLGDLRASREFYFLLMNGGDVPIFDVRLETGNEAFIITPDHFDVLPGRTVISDDATPAFIPLITLGVMHGTQLYGIGYTDLLEMGSHSSTITVSGKTLLGTDTITVSDEFIVEIVARVMDISIQDGLEELDLTKWDFAVSSNLGGLGFVRGYDVYNDNIELRNTGNVQLQVSFGEDWSIPSNSMVLQPEEATAIALVDDHVFLKLDSDGTVADESRIQLGNDGNGYLCLKYLSHIEDTTGFEPDTLRMN
jgi:hypothetical protein